LNTETVVESPVDTLLNLSVSHLIAVKVKGFWPDESEFETTTELYHMADPQSSDGWDGNPTVCSMGQYRVSPTELSGKIVIMTLPFHDGYRPKLQGNGSSIKFFQYLFDEEFISSTINRQEIVGSPRLKVDPSYPNPFNPVTTLRYHLTEDGLVKITIYDLLGREVKRLVNSEQTAGYKSIQWDATNDAGSPVSAGLYLYTIQVGEFRQTKKMVLMK
jgi:hypothetical protein